MKRLDKYSQKEILVFQGIMDLLNKGQGIHELKVADIAAAAGMGKSTVYEYFETKEDIIKQALNYHVYKEYLGFTDLIKEQSSFEDIINSVMDYAIEMITTRFSSLLFMVLNLGQSDVKQLIVEDNALFLEIRSSINEHMEKIYYIGKGEYKIGPDTSLEDCSLVVFGIISAFINDIIFMKNKEFFPENAVFPVGLKKEDTIEIDSLKELKDRALRLILKALK